jgi:histidine triad (HIT) family protein
MVAGEIPFKKAHEDEHVLAFHDIAPQAPVHVLLIPKSHLTSLDDATPEHHELLGHLLCLVPRLAAQLGLSESGYRTVINTGADGGQSVFHLHIHLLGGRPLAWPPG